MRKYLFLLLFLFCSFIQVNAQSIVTDTQWQKLIGYLNQEDWQRAEALSKSYLQGIPKDKIDEDAASILRYMYITSEAGLMNSRTITQNQALVAVLKFCGHKLILPSRPLSLKSGFNSIELLNNKADTLFVTSANKIADEIFSFEYIVPDNSYSVAEFEQNNGKMCRTRGILKSIKVEGHMFPRFKIVIDNARLAFDN